MADDARRLHVDPALIELRAATWREIAPHLPRRLAGMTALEVGAPAARCGLELARRGARVAIVEPDPDAAAQARADAAERGLQGHLDVVQADIYELAHDLARFDLVLCLGLFERVRYPLLALDIAARRCRGELVFRATEAPGVEPPLAGNVARITPRLAHRTPDRLAMSRTIDPDGHPTGGWRPDPRTTETMLGDAGLRVRCRLPGDTWLCTHDAALGTRSGRRDDAQLHAATVALDALRQPRGH